MKDERMPTEDLELILQRGCFESDDQRYCVSDGNGVLRILPRGRRLLRVSLLMHFCDPSPADCVTSVESLRACAMTIKQVRVWRAMDAAFKVRTGRIPDDAIELAHAAAEGSMADLHRATERRMRKCVRQPANVVFANFQCRHVEDGEMAAGRSARGEL
ncbi:hypothetical protein [Povalibacter sp.]|uniref:hypothetical protein n=1 Tax=Povalibacter sp. TaxID=1962978 RepID=UPI002F3EC681